MPSALVMDRLSDEVRQESPWTDDVCRRRCHLWWEQAEGDLKVGKEQQWELWHAEGETGACRHWDVDVLFGSDQDGH